jgi:putative esterase
MHATAWLLPIVLLSCILLLTCRAAGDVSISDLPVPQGELSPVPWVSPEDDSWHQGKPLFTLGEGSDDSSAQGWVAVTESDIRLYVLVKDDGHENNQTGGNVWNGDAIQIGIDGRGDGSCGMSPETHAMFGPDDAALTFALTSSGPVAYVHFSGKSGLGRTSLPQECAVISRDDATKITTYDLRIPWSALDTPPGLFPTIGLAVQINDNDPNGDAQARLHWGRGADGVPRPGRFERLLPGDPSGSRVHALPSTGVLWGPDDQAEIQVVVASDAPQVVRATLGDDRVEKTIPGDGRPHRLVVRGRPADLASAADGLAMKVVVSPQGGKPVLDESVALVVPEAVYQDVVNRCATLARKAEHPLMARHLRSVQAVVQMEWARLTLYAEGDPLTTKATLGRLQKLQIGLAGTGGKWQTYLDGKRELVISFLSRRDQTVQYYHLGLPKDWDPDKAYPLFLELHGAGDANPLNGIAAHVGGDEGSTPTLAGYTAPITYAGLQRNGYHLMPFGRGNTGYRDIGETDVWEALADFDRNFKTDPDRRYLYGFSMGGGGTWALGARTPDKWAAIAIFAGAVRGDSWTPSLGRNVTYLPTWMWAGEDDRFFRSISRLREMMREYGAEPTFSSTPNLGHNYLGEKQVEAINWLQQHTRKRPDAFQFVADTTQHSGVWGINMARDPAMSGLPSFVCKIEGNTVRLDTDGTPQVEINLGEGGLGLTGEATVILNGKQAYQGAVETVKLKTTE